MSTKKQFRKNKEIIHTETRTIQYKQYEGLLPSPDIIETYERLHEGSIVKFFEIAQKQVDSRIRNENKLVDASTNATNKEIIFNFLSQVLAFILLMSILIIGAFLAYKKENYAVLGVTVITTLITSLTTIFKNKK